MIEARHVEPPLEEKLEILKGWYESTGNALYAWEAMDECLRADVPMPGWAKEYFRRVSSRLADRESVPAKGEGEVGKFVLRALDLNVRSGPGRFSERLLWHRQNVARVRAMVAAMKAFPHDEAARLKRYEVELQALGFEPETLLARVNRTFPDKT